MSITKMLPITISADGCFCNQDCKYHRSPYGWCFLQGKFEDAGCIGCDIGEDCTVEVDERLGHAYIRTVYCCETFQYEDTGENAKFIPTYHGVYNCETSQYEDEEEPEIAKE